MGATLVAAIGGLLFGYDTAVISGAVSAIDANFIEPRHLAETARNSLSGFTVSSALLGCVIGGAGAGWVGQVLGRKRGMLLAAFLFLISAIGSAPVSYTHLDVYKRQSLYIGSAVADPNRLRRYDAFFIPPS